VKVATVCHPVCLLAKYLIELDRVFAKLGTMFEDAVPTPVCFRQPFVTALGLGKGSAPLYLTSEKTESRYAKGRLEVVRAEGISSGGIAFVLRLPHALQQGWQVHKPQMAMEMESPAFIGLHGCKIARDLAKYRVLPSSYILLEISRWKTMVELTGSRIVC
jgi:hypothetical protein